MASVCNQGLELAPKNNSGARVNSSLKQPDAIVRVASTEITWIVPGDRNKIISPEPVIEEPPNQVSYTKVRFVKDGLRELVAGG